MEMLLKRRVEETHLEPSEFLIPLFEAIVNSIQAINERNVKGKITINILRDNSQAQMFDGGSNELENPIKSFEIIDNGVGFREINLKAFSQAYTEYKKEIGGKGVGRITMLAAFEKVTVESVYKDTDKYQKIIFDFNPIDEVHNKKIEDTKSKEEYTKINLINYDDKFNKRSRISSKKIAEEIVEHCLLYFITKSVPSIELIETSTNVVVDCNKLFSDYLSKEGNEEIFKVKKEVFNLTILKRRDVKEAHKAFLCAHKRLVKPFELSTYNANLSAKFNDDNGAYSIYTYITSAFFDKKVNSIRNKFNIPTKKNDVEFESEISLEEIIEEVIKILSKKYKNEIKEIESIKIKKIEGFIMNDKKPRLEYRHLLSKPDLFKEISPNSSEDKIEEQLHKISYNADKERTKKIDKMLKKSKVEDYDEYFEELRKLLESEQVFTKDRLADYILRRKAILQVFKRFLALDKNKDYKLEADLHSIIFPMGQTSDSIPYNNHNLWLLDERLTYHSFIASDKQLRTNPISKNKSQKEPDILIFDYPWAYTDDADKINSIIIFEFKRPAREFTGDERDVHNQVIGYFEDLEKSNAKDYRGRLLRISDTTPKFGYVVCDVTKDLENFLRKKRGFRLTSYNSLYLSTEDNMHIEIISYSQLLESAEIRHKAFFKELGINI